jgi:hypothetical protein
MIEPETPSMSRKISAESLLAFIRRVVTVEFVNGYTNTTRHSNPPETSLGSRDYRDPSRDIG